MLIAALVRKCAAFGRSVVGRLVLLALVMVASTAMLRTYVLTDVLKDDVHGFAASQQLALTDQVAQSLGGKLRDRQLVLSHLGRRIVGGLLDSPTDLRRYLGEHDSASFYFPGGLGVVDSSDGRLLAAVADAALPWGEDASGQDWFMAARDGRPAAQTTWSARDGEAVLVLAMPAFDAGGRVAAVVSGVIAVRGQGLLGLLDRTSGGPAGILTLTMPEIARVVSGTEESRVLQPLPEPGRDNLADRALTGFRGSSIEGDDLASVAPVPGTRWFVITRLPQERAFAVLYRLHDFILRNSLVTGAAVVLILVLVLPHLLRPLSNGAAQMRAMAEGRAPLRPLPIVRRDEIGEMVAGFNYLLERLKANEDRMAHMAHHDALTGLPNRALFEDRLDQAFLHAERQGKGFALLFMDLDGFKPVNDVHGHDVGDEVLRQVAARLKAVVRRGDTVARYGGDEFVVILPDLDQPAQFVSALAEKLCLAVSVPYAVNGLILNVGLSVGSALYPWDGADAAALVAHADQDMYRVKRARRD